LLKTPLVLASTKVWKYGLNCVDLMITASQIKYRMAEKGWRLCCIESGVRTVIGDLFDVTLLSPLGPEVSVVRVIVTANPAIVIPPPTER
jgi:hypothetical protein